MTRGCQVVVSAQRHALEAVVQVLEQVLSFVRVGCLVAFSVCFEAREWPNIETPEMCQEWMTKEPIEKSKIENLTREIIQVYREVYYALWKSEVDQVATARAREETTTRLVIVEASLAAQQAAWEKEQSTLIAKRESKKATFVSQLGDTKRESDVKEMEFWNIAKMMKRALELQMQAKVDLDARTQRVHELQAQQNELRARRTSTTPTLPGTHPSSS